MVDINPIISIITLNINGLNTSIKRQRLSEWIKKGHPTVCCLQEPHFKGKEIQIKSQWGKTYHANTNF